MKKDSEQKKKIAIAKKDSFGLFSGKFKSKEFGGKKEELEKAEKKKKQKGYNEDI